MKITVEASPHHLTLTDDDVLASAARHAPEDEPAAARRGATARPCSTACATARVDCIATDHAPHARDEKEVPFEEAPMGTTGLETAFAAVHTELVVPGVLPISPLVVETHVRARRALRAPGAAESRVGRRGRASCLDRPRRRSGRSARHGYASRSENCCFAGLRAGAGAWAR